MQSPLNHHVTFRGRDFEQLQRYLSGKSLSIRPETTRGHQAQNLDARLCGVYFDGFYLSHMRYDMDTLVTACDPDSVDYFIQFPQAGAVSTRTRQGWIDCDSSITSVSSPGNPYSIRSDRLCERFCDLPL